MYRRCIDCRSYLASNYIQTIINLGEIERSGEEAVLPSFRIVSRPLPGAPEENHEIHQSG
jgi:hypothetical protein